MNCDKSISLQTQLGLDFFILKAPIKKDDIEFYNYENFNISYNLNNNEWLVYM